MATTPARRAPRGDASGYRLATNPTMTMSSAWARLRWTSSTRSEDALRGVNYLAR
jgi:hypothetical protein